MDMLFVHIACFYYKSYLLLFSFFRDSKRRFLVSNRQLHFEYSFRIATQFILKSMLLNVFNLLFIHFNNM